MNLNLKFKNFYVWPLAAKIIFILFVCLIVLFLGYYFDFSNIQKRLAVAKQQEIDFKAQLNSVFQKQASFQADLAKQNELESILVMLQSKLVKANQLPQALNEILKIGSANGLQFVSFSPDKEESDGIYKRLPIKAVVIGSYDQIANFIAQISQMTSLISLSEFVIKTPNIATTSQPNAQALPMGLLNADIILEAYYLNGEAKDEKPKQ